MQARRGAMPPEEAAPESGLDISSFYRFERGDRVPSLKVAVRIAEWLGAPWTAGAVIDAARRPAE